MKILAFDTETTGITTSDDLSAPHAVPVQLAAKLIDITEIPEYPFTIRSHADLKLIIQTEGVPIPAGAAAVHGISDAMVDAYGVERDDAAFAFAGLLQQADAILGHNVTFDIRIMRHFFHDLKFEGDPFARHKVYDTMKVSTNICKVPKSVGRGYKWPKLTEAHRFFRHWEEQQLCAKIKAAGFNRAYNQMELDEELTHFYKNAHDAMIDTNMAIEVFYSFCRYTGADLGKGTDIGGA